MTNPYYTFTPPFVPGTLARSGDVNTQFTLVQSAFDKVTDGKASIGIDSGVVNTVVLTMTTTRTAYVNGDEIVFMPAVQNTGAATVKVDALAAVPLVRFNGTPLQNADLLTGSWYIARYSSATNSFEIVSPAAYTAAAGIVSAAAPTHKVGLAAAGGVSVNVLPIDATFAIDQAIAPTWTALHTFGAGVTVSAGLVSIASSAVVGAATGGSQGVGTINAVGLFVNGVAVSLGVTANPSGLIGMTAVNGVATTLTRSDSTHAIDPAIAPTWTGTHTWSGSTQVKVSSSALVSAPGLSFSSNAAMGLYDAGTNILGFSTAGISRGTINATGNWNLVVPASGNTLTVNAINGNVGLTYADGTATAGFYTSGVGAADTNYMGTTSNHPMGWITNGAIRGTISAAGNITFNAPSSGKTLQINVLDNTTIFDINSTTTANGYFGTFSRAGTASGYIGVGPALFTGGALTDFGLASNGAFRISSNSGTTTNILIAGTGAVSIAAPASGNALSVAGVVNSNAIQIQGSASAGGSFGLRIFAGTNNTDVAFDVLNSASSVNYFRVLGNGQILGAGPVAASLVDMTPDRSTFPITYTGMTATTTGTAVFSRQGNQVTLTLPALTGTSNSTSFTATGLPASLQPLAQAHLIVAPNFFESNGAATNATIALAVSSGTITFGIPTNLTTNTAGWAAAGTKGTSQLITFTYFI